MLLSCGGRKAQTVESHSSLNVKQMFVSFSHELGFGREYLLKTDVLGILPLETNFTLL